MFSSVLYPGMEFLIPLASDRCWLKCQRLVGWLSGGTWWTLYHNSDCRQTKWQQVDQIACWSRVCASSQLAESPLWVPQGIVFGFHSQMLHTRSRHAPPRISFILTNVPVSFTNPAFSTGLKQWESVFWNQSVLLMCHFSAPEDAPYIIIHCLEYRSPPVCLLSPAEFPGIWSTNSLALLIRLAASESQGEKSQNLYLYPAPQMIFKDIKVRLALPRDTLVHRNHM